MLASLGFVFLSVVFGLTEATIGDPVKYGAPEQVHLSFGGDVLCSIVSCG